jgi:hypothetical protein
MMKPLSLFFLALLWSFCAFGQTEALDFKRKQADHKDLVPAELRDHFIKYNFSEIFTHADNSIVYGFIGTNYQRIRIKILSVTKDTLSADTYHVFGKSMVKNNVNEFNGTIKISSVRKFIKLAHACENEDKFKGYRGEYMLLGDYDFQENTNEPRSGTFKGSLRSDFYLTKDRHVYYDDIENCADSYANNQFVGEWTAYEGSLTERCNWGDFRIPNSGDLDEGAGEFSPAKYAQYGWQDFDKEKKKHAKWWEKSSRKRSKRP